MLSFSEIKINSLISVKKIEFFCQKYAEIQFVLIVQQLTQPLYKSLHNITYVNLKLLIAIFAKKERNLSKFYVS